MADNLDMQKDIIAAAPNIGKSESLGFIKPFYPCSLDRQLQKLFWTKTIFFFVQIQWHSNGCLDLDHNHRLQTPRGFLGLKPNWGSIRHGALTKIAQNIGM